MSDKGRQKLAQGSGPDGTTWTVTAYGDGDDYYTFIHVDGRQGSLGEGGFGGPPLHVGEPLNVYHGLADAGPLRLLVRAGLRAETLHVQLQDGSTRVLTCAARVPARGVAVFAALLPRDAHIRALSAEDADGNRLAG